MEASELPRMPRLYDHIDLRVRDLGRTEPYEASAADVSRLRELLAWTPPTDLARGIRQIVEYERGRSEEGVARAR